MARSLAAALADLEGRLRRARSPIFGGLRPGLSEADVKSQFDGAALKPRAALAALYMWHDGAEGAGPPAELMDTARFLSLREAIDNRRFELGLAVENEAPPELPAAEIFDPGWFPILADASGRMYVVEELGGGRVMIVDRMQVGAHEMLGPSLAGFIDSLARDGLDYRPPPPSADVAQLVARLESQDEKERVRAINELTRKRPAASFEPLVAMLQSEYPPARGTAALILGLLRDPRAIPILIRCMARWSVESGDVRKYATSAWAGLRDVSDNGVMSHLEHALAQGDRELRLDAVAGLAFTRDARAAVVLQEAASRDPDPGVRAAAERALRALGEPR